MGKSSGTQQVVNRTELPPWLDEAAQENLRIAGELAQRPYQPYGGSVIAGFSPEQEAAFGMAQGNIGAYQPTLGAATGAALQGASYQPQQVTAPSFLGGDLSGYMNPYLSEVEQRATSNLQRGLQQNLNQIASQASQARAFGGSRQAIQEGVATSEAARAAGDLSAQLRQQGFQQAAALQQADQARAMQAALANQQAGLAGAGLNLQGAQALSGLAQQQQSMGLTDVATMQGIGAERQALEQRQLEDAYARFVEQRDYPERALQLRLQAIGATPYGQTTTQTKTGGDSGSSFLTGLGGAGSLLSGIAALASF